MSLADIQEKFTQALLDGEFAPQSLAFFCGDDARNLQRLALYRGNLAAAWHKALAAAYPVLQALVGEEFFYALSRAYGRAHPSTDGDLNRFGARFADFLAGFEHVAEYPYFSDMARLEWALHCACYADNAAALPPARFAATPAQALADARLVLHPACALIRSDWDIAQIWLAHQPGALHGLPQDFTQPCAALVVRPAWKAGLLPLTPAAAIALDMLAAGTTLGAAIDAALAIDPRFDLGSHLGQWIDHGVFIELQFSDQE